MSRGSCYRARGRPPWIVSPLTRNSVVGPFKIRPPLNISDGPTTRNSLAGAARSWPIIEAQSKSTRCSARQDFAPY